jgi:hypothetical protein
MFVQRFATVCTDILQGDSHGEGQGQLSLCAIVPLWAPRLPTLQDVRNMILEMD